MDISEMEVGPHTTRDLQQIAPLVRAKTILGTPPPPIVPTSEDAVTMNTSPMAPVRPPSLLPLSATDPMAAPMMPSPLPLRPNRTPTPFAVVSGASIRPRVPSIPVAKPPSEPRLPPISPLGASVQTAQINAALRPQPVPSFAPHPIHSITRQVLPKTDAYAPGPTNQTVPLPGGPAYAPAPTPNGGMPRFDTPQRFSQPVIAVPPVLTGPPPASDGINGRLSFHVYTPDEMSRPKIKLPNTESIILPTEKMSLGAKVCMMLIGVCVVFGTAAAIIAGTSDDPKTVTVSAAEPPQFAPPQPPVISAPPPVVTPAIAAPDPPPPASTAKKPNSKKGAPKPAGSGLKGVSPPPNPYAK